MSNRAEKGDAKASPSDIPDNITGGITSGANLLTDGAENLSNLGATGSQFLNQGQEGLTAFGSNFLSKGQKGMQDTIASGSNILSGSTDAVRSGVQNAKGGADAFAGNLSATGSNVLKESLPQMPANPLSGSLRQNPRVALQSGIQSAGVGALGDLSGIAGSSHEAGEGGLADLQAAGSGLLGAGQDQLEGLQAVGSDFLGQGQAMLGGDDAAAFGSNLLSQGQKSLEGKVAAGSGILSGSLPRMPLMKNVTAGAAGAAFGSVAAGASSLTQARDDAQDNITSSLPEIDAQGLEDAGNGFLDQGGQALENIGTGYLSQTQARLEKNVQGRIAAIPGAAFLSQPKGKLGGEIAAAAGLPNIRDVKLDGVDIVSAIPGADHEEKLSGGMNGLEEKFKNGIEIDEKKLTGDLEGFKAILEGYIDGYVARVMDRVYRTPRSTPPTEKELERWEERTKLIAIITNIFTTIIFILFLVLIIILFVAPGAYHNPSLIGPQLGDKQQNAKQTKSKSDPLDVANQLAPQIPSPSLLHGVQPQVLVTLLATALIATASMLISRFVEHDMWLRKGCTPQEVKLKAQWPRSPPTRIAYVTVGASNTLKLAGVLMLPFVIVPTVLIAGISQSATTTVNVTNVANSSSAYSGFLNGGSALFFAGNPGMEAAAIASLQGLSLPPSTLTPCGENNDCDVSATSGAVRAICETGTRQNAISGSNPVFILNSKLNDTLSVQLASGGAAGDLYAVFKTSTYPSRSWIAEQLLLQKGGSPSSLSVGNATLPSATAPSSVPTGITKRQVDNPTSSTGGVFGIILGAYRDLNSSDVHTVECKLTFGTTTITQTGQSTPELHNDASFKPSAQGFYDSDFRLPALTFAFDASSVWAFTAQRTALDTSQGRPRGSVTGSPTIGWFLLWGNNTITPPDVLANNIATAFDMYTLLAWIKTPGASSMTATSTETVQKYVYNWRFLFILLAPVLAVLLAGFGRLKVGGAHTVPGYDPIRIAQSGLGDLDAAMERPAGYSEKNPTTMVEEAATEKP